MCLSEPQFRLNHQFTALTVTITDCPVLKPSSSSHFYAAVNDGSLLLRDTAKQVQDIATLSRDVEHAKNALSPIFNKEKE
ncbi:hypothetical protein PZA22_16245 [Pectobacterium polaris]|uniref:hypothetical protein n=1 Tax=Pectobacterium polaris TaxID=2042057 RepID=UPI0023B0AAC6|nr:hypothetical protein [Pectobacterium polaris]MDE8756037.1 hypothetical protein [Pectobacterium polaris]